MKICEDGKKKDNTDCMNIIGLDIRKIPSVPKGNRNDETFQKI